MKFGLLFEMQRPFQGNDVDWNPLYRETLDQCETDSYTNLTLPKILLV